MHIPVLIDEVISYLRPELGGVFLDGTVGMGGHSEKLIKSGAGEVFAIDRDRETLAETVERLQDLPIQFFHTSFDKLGEAISAEKMGEFDGILLDLGISSRQLDDCSRGFSFQLDGPLDMRMDRSDENLTAAEIVQNWGESELEQVIRQFGEERYAGRIARAIVRERNSGGLKTTRELESVIFHATPARHRHQRIHPATRTFQALRIAVNDEMQALSRGLGQLLPWLKDGGRIAVISFHSLEDRIVKHQFRQWSSEKIGRIITKKPIMASEDEISRNSRSRSAKLRIFEKGLLDGRSNTS
ncbi:16S rRNA (cytosine(1402)-N(4))-methyltransferase RsmH [Bdellovibrionota bacterium]